MIVALSITCGILFVLLVGMTLICGIIAKEANRLRNALADVDKGLDEAIVIARRMVVKKASMTD